VPTLWLLVCTLTAGLQKVFSSVPGIGFLSHAWQFSEAASAGKVLRRPGLTRKDRSHITLA
jgi:carbon starvation protein